MSSQPPEARRKLVFACQHVIHGTTGVVRVFDEGDAWRVSLYVPRTACTVDRFSAPLSGRGSVDRDALKDWALSLLMDVQPDDVGGGGGGGGALAAPPERGLDAAKQHRLRGAALAAEGRFVEAEAALRDAIRCWSLFAAARLSLVSVLLRLRRSAEAQREALATVSTVRRLQARVRRSEAPDDAARAGACAETEGAPLGRLAAAAYSLLSRAYAAEGRYPRAVNAMVLALREARVTVLGREGAGGAAELLRSRRSAAAAASADDRARPLAPTGEPWADAYVQSLQALLDRQHRQVGGMGEGGSAATGGGEEGAAATGDDEAALVAADAVGAGASGPASAPQMSVLDVEELVSRHWLLPGTAPLRFQCTGCGQCCRSADHIFLHPLDLWQMSRAPALRAARGVGSTTDLHAAFADALHRSARLGAPLLSLRPAREKQGRCAFSFPLYKAHGSGRLLTFVEVEDRGLNGGRRAGRRGGGRGGPGEEDVGAGDGDDADEQEVPYVRAQPHEYMLTESDLEEEQGAGGGEGEGEGEGAGGGEGGEGEGSGRGDREGEGEGEGGDDGSSSDGSELSAPPPPYDAAVAAAAAAPGGGAASEAGSEGDEEAAELEEDEAALEGLMPHIDLSTDEGDADDSERAPRGCGSRRRARQQGPAKERATPVYNTFGTPALGCALGVAHMPTLCASYPVARELSWAEFWRAGVPSEDAHAHHMVVATDECEGFRDDALERAEGVWGTAATAAARAQRERPGRAAGDGAVGHEGDDDSDAAADADDASVSRASDGGHSSDESQSPPPPPSGAASLPAGGSVRAFLQRAGVAPRWREHDWFLRDCLGVVCASRAVAAIQPYAQLSGMLARALWLAWYDFDRLPAARSRPLTSWPAARGLIGAVTARAVAAAEAAAAELERGAVGSEGPDASAGEDPAASAPTDAALDAAVSEHARAFAGAVRAAESALRRGLGEALAHEQ